jgi:hypothetical protein
MEITDGIRALDAILLPHHAHDPGHVQVGGSGLPPPVGPEAGYVFKDDHWERASAQDSVEQAPTQPGYVAIHDHSTAGGDPSTWSIAQWKAALKADPEKYTALFHELALDGHLSKDVTEHKAEMTQVVADELQKFNTNMQLLKSITDANHETLKSMAQFRV